MRKPFYRKREKCWFVETDRGEVRLDSDEEKAFTLWESMRAAGAEVTRDVSLPRLVEEWLSVHDSDKQRFRQDVQRIISFLHFVGGRKRANSVTHSDVREWLTSEKPGRLKKDGSRGAGFFWSARTKKDAYEALMRVYRWAVSEGILAKNPIAGLKLEASSPRSSTVSKDDHAKLMQAVEPEFRQYLLAASCGVRPRQIREVTASNVSPLFDSWVFDRHKTDRTGKQLIVYLPPCLQTLTKILVAARPNGPLFRNSRGQPWKKDTVAQKLRRLRKKLGLSPDLVNYAYRHTFATDALVNEIPIQTVATLMGHADTRMVARTYGHLDKHRQYLLEAAAKAGRKSGTNE